ncbi:MAG: methyltransferase domain-containing protein [Acidimicrobiia bacterium]|nr:methyltransferase domain-containing protein [Acidimicrobiia bacterium]
MALSVPQHDPLSVAAVGNAFVDRVYAKLSPVYDLVFGAALQAGRVAAVARMNIQPGDHVLEVGVGTGINTSLYPRDCRVSAVDLSAPMLEKARERVEREGLTHVRLFEMDAAHLTFRDDSFDCVYAPYLMSVVPDPVKVAREMYRVCRPAGRLVILNHFRSPNPILSCIEQALSPFTVHVGFKADLDLPGFLEKSGLRPAGVERVNYPPIWSLVTVVKR